MVSTVGTQASAVTNDDAQRRRQRETFAMKSGWPELARADLRFDRYSVVHEPSGDEYRIYRGEVDHAIGTTHPCTA